MCNPVDMRTRLLYNYSNEKNEIFSLHINQFLEFRDLVDRANVLSEGVVNVF